MKKIIYLYLLVIFLFSCQKQPQKARIETNYGDIIIELYDTTPEHKKNFVKLIKQGFYDSLLFHRVIKDFMIQGGDPDGNGRGGPGYSFDDEIDDANENNVGTIAMANSGPNTNGSQFFINVKNNNFLDKKHTFFGKVVKGMDVVTKIENTQTGPNDKPVKDIIIENIELELE